MAVENDSYCSEAEVAAITGVNVAGNYSATTTPTEAQVLVFMAARAGEVYARLYQYMGAATPGPAAYSVTVDTSTDPGKALDVATRHANSLGAAIDALQAAGVGESPSRGEAIIDLNALYQQALDGLRDIAIAYIGTANRSETHISAGDVTVPSRTATDQQGVVFTSSTDF